jgi:hypothetical protein
MKQDPYQLISDVHEQLANSENDYKILSNYSTAPELWGYSKIWLFVALLPAMLVFRFSASVLSGWDQLYGIGASLVLAVLALAVTRATPQSMDAEDYFTSTVSHFIQQNDMIHTTDPDDSHLVPPPTSVVETIRRLPLVRAIPVVGVATAATQDLVTHEKPYRDGEYAICRDDGAFIAAMRIRPIPLRLESDDAREKVERSVAKALESTVDYDAQWYSPQRVADYGERRESWAARSQEFEEQAVRGEVGADDGDASSVEAIRKQILADVAAERAAGINLYEKTKHIREFYLLVSVDAGEVVLDRSAEEGGVGSIPGVGWLVEKKRLREQGDSDEHVDAMLRKLSRRVSTLSTELQRIEGLTTIPLSAMEFSEQVADYYRPTNVQAYDDFGSCIRGAPVPVDDEVEADESDSEGSSGHITNNTDLRDEMSESPAAEASPSEPVAETSTDAPKESRVRTDGVVVGGTGGVESRNGGGSE